MPVETARNRETSGCVPLVYYYPLAETYYPNLESRHRRRAWRRPFLEPDLCQAMPCHVVFFIE